ncbi:MAG: peptide ABC transporter substrate-binding protein [Gammaproteobacteria bacterium]|nr:peptide ABC transporter substrate-binding protein [Gammaproteobacteria bacterium]
MRRFCLGLSAALLIAACSGAVPTPSSAPGQPVPAPAAPKSLVVAILAEPQGFGEMFAGGKSGPEHLQAMVHRQLAQPDERGTYRADIAAELPSQDRGTWQLFPDGRMDTTWQLRPNVLWHDGTPLTSEDVVFSWQVAIAPDVPYKQREAASLIDDIQPLDEHSFVIHWKGFFLGADHLTVRDLFLLPEHILEPSFDGDRTTFVNSTYWNTSFVGLGPYRLTSWTPGASVQLEAFDGFYGDSPRIKSITVRFIEDTNTELASLLGGQTDVQLGRSLGLEDALVLKNQWESAGEGKVLTYPRGIFEIRFAPNDNRVADARVRQALYYGMDRQGIVNNLYSGLVDVANSYMNPEADGFDVIDARTTKYPYDPARAAALLADMGWRPAGDGMLRTSAGDGFDLPFSTTAGDEERTTLQTAIANMWSTLGFNVQIQNVPTTVENSPDYQFLTTDLSGVATDFDSNVPRIDGRELRTPQNPRGTNVWGEVNPEIDRLLDQWRRTTDEAASIQLQADVIHQVSEDLRILPINYRVEVVAVRSGVTGVPVRTEVLGNNSAWNVEDWDRG